MVSTNTVTSSTSSAKTLPLIPALTKQQQQQPASSNPWMFDDEAKIYLWKLIHTWLRHEKLQAKWAAVINDLLLRILQSCPSETPLSSSLGTSIQLFETGAPSQSKYLPGIVDGTVLQTLTDLPLPSIYGGTVRLYGAPLSLHAKLTDIMAISLYTLYSLQLEVAVMRDHHVTLSTLLSESDTSSLDASPLSTTATTTTTTEGGLWKYGLLGWVLGKRGGKTTATGEKEIHSEKPQTPKRRLSMLAMKNSTKKPADNKLALPLDASDPHYYQQMRLGLERACISTSPSCIFVTPSIVTVLENEEENMNTMKMIISNGQQQQKQKQQRSSDQTAVRSKLTSLARRSSSILSLGPADQQRKSTTTASSSDTVTLPQSITAYNMLRIPKPILTGTNKIGMAQLYLDSASIDAFIHHQQLVLNYTSYPIGCPDRPCLGPILCTIHYFHFDDRSPHSDQTLETTLNRWLEESTHPCKNHLEKLACCNNLTVPPPFMRRNTTTESSSQDHNPVTLPSGGGGDGSEEQSSTTTTTIETALHGCKQPLQDHVLCFSHGSSRINVYFTSSTSPPDQPLQQQDDGLTCWLLCTLCDARTQARPISPSTAYFSFAKYLELCFYSTRFTADTTLCAHVKSPTAIARCFGRPSTSAEIRFVKEDIHVYRLTGSPLQVVQPPPPPSNSVSPRISRSTMDKWILREGRAIEDLFKQLHRHLAGLCASHSATRTRQHQHQWESDRLLLLDTLKKASLNDFRRFFAMQASTIVDDLNRWQVDVNGDEDGLFTWKARPDYMNTDINATIHCFPDSAVMVRELEPTSIIAYTLSSSEYVDELLSERSSATATTVPSSTKTTPPLSPTRNSSKQSDVIDGYFATIERKYISPSTGAATETASFRTMVMETVRGSDPHRLTKHLASPLSLRRIQRQQTTERDLGPSAKDIKESTVYHNPGVEDSDLLSPHIKHRFVHGNVEFICTVYYANAFEVLRKSCGVDQLVIESLCRCQSWATTGGKSKSQFYKTQDDRLVVKEMVNAWNIAEKDAFLRFAPKYFDYVKESVKAPSLLAKIFGFYSIQMQTGDEKVLNIDVLVMEQLFYGQSISKVDEDRRGQEGCTLWDGDWRDGYRMGYVTHEQSRQWIKVAMERDTQFLAANNIMDYSLLVGVDTTKKELSIGLVDYIGTYTWYKKIESKSKSTLNRNREVTVLPPDQYRARFCRQVRDSFVSVPGKFDNIAPDQTSPSTWMK